jgi:hypothetical protein
VALAVGLKDVETEQKQVFPGSTDEIPDKVS